MTASITQDTDEMATVARWGRELATDQRVTCDLIPYGFEDCGYRWALVEQGEIAELVETDHRGFVRIADWLGDQERAGAISAIACGTYVYPLRELATARLTTRQYQRDGNRRVRISTRNKPLAFQCLSL